jgi:hypothetical protein
VFVDSPNIRLEVEMPERAQPGKYLADFSQLDVEVRRNRGVTEDDYYDRPDDVAAILRADWEKALRFFEGMVRSGVGRALDTAEEHLQALGVRELEWAGAVPFLTQPVEGRTTSALRPGSCIQPGVGRGWG